MWCHFLHGHVNILKFLHVNSNLSTTIAPSCHGMANSLELSRTVPGYRGVEWHDLWLPSHIRGEREREGRGKGRRKKSAATAATRNCLPWQHTAENVQFIKKITTQDQFVWFNVLFMHKNEFQAIHIAGLRNLVESYDTYCASYDTTMTAMIVKFSYLKQGDCIFQHQPQKKNCNFSKCWNIVTSYWCNYRI